MRLHIRDLIWNAVRFSHNEKEHVVFYYIGPSQVKKYLLQISDVGLCLKLIKDDQRR